MFIEQLSEAGRVLQQPMQGCGWAPGPNDHEFIAAVHRAWKALHLKAIQEIIAIDTIEEKHRERPIDGGFVAYLSHIRQAWRKINDGIVWPLCGGHRHLVKRLCFYRKRGHLASANPGAALPALETFNAEPLTIALWSDATTCVDAGDIIRYDASKGELHLIELKSGQVNTAILELVGRPAMDQIFTQLDAFAGRYGEQGIEQLQRVLRQEDRNRQAIRLMHDDRGVDPITGTEMEIHELKTPGEYYDEELARIVREATRSGSSVAVDVRRRGPRPHYA